MKYGWEIIFGVSQPTRASWIVWVALDVLTLAGMVAAGSENFQIIAVVAGGLIVLGFALWKGKPGWSSLDKWCLFGSFVGIIAWLVTKSPVYGILIAQGVGILRSIPTFASALEDPTREDRLAWAIFWVSCILQICDIKVWDLEHAAQPLAFFFIQSVMMYILFIHPRLKDKAANQSS